MQDIEKLLCPAGDGVYAIHTAKDKRNDLQKKLYGATESAVERSWLTSLKDMEKSQNLLLGICSDTGGGILRGANWGPMFIRHEMLKRNSRNYLDIGDIRVIPHLLHDKYLNSATIKECRLALYKTANTNLPVSPLSITELVTKELYKNYPDKRIFALGGDHSVSYPLVKNYLQAKKIQQKRVAVIHFDAHTDLLDKRLGIDICFGSWTYHILQYLEEKDDLIQIGIRSTGNTKQHWESSFGIQQIWAKEVKTMGATKIAEQICKQLQKKQVTELYISFDIDAIDQAYVSATGTPEPNGLMPEDALQIIQNLKQNFAITGGDLVEVAPMVNRLQANNRVSEPDSTLTIAAAILQAMTD